jgi:hypothetical protein
MNITEWNNMSFESFLQNLTRLDWFYQMSDDHRAYTRGRQACNDYRELAESNGPKWVDAYLAESKKHQVSS